MPLRFSVTLIVPMLALLVSCGSERTASGSEGTAYVGPAELKLYDQLGPAAQTSLSVRHGEEVHITARRRSFVQIRSSSGVEGWTHFRQLLTEEEMDELRRLADYAAALPSQGQATVFSALNVHTEANRQAPSFRQIQEGEKVDVLLYRRLERQPYQARTELKAREARQQKAVRKGAAGKPSGKAKPEEKDSEGRLVLRLSAPTLPVPANWLDISGKYDPAASAAEEPKAPERVVPADDWTLVRLAGGSAGWVLARMLFMAIPDSVAQYAEGHRITSYFPLGEANDSKGGTQKHWLWTTISKHGLPYDFDGFRVFIWNTRKGRYETAYIERRVKGFLPVELKSIEVTEGRQMLKTPGFSLVVEEADGVRYRKTYAFMGYRVRTTGKHPAPPPPPGDPWKMTPEDGDDLLTTPSSGSLVTMVRSWFR
jgi:hypothetical protein